MSYRTGTFSSGLYSLSELHLLKPLMKRGCLGDTASFENAFNNLIEFQSNPDELDGIIWSNLRKPLRQEFLNDLSTKQLATHRGGVQYKLVFWQNSVAQMLNNMSEREVTAQIEIAERTYYNSFGFVVEVHKDQLIVSIGDVHNGYPLSDRSSRDITKLIKYLDKLCMTAIRMNLIGILPHKANIGEPLMLGVPCSNSVGYKGDAYLFSSNADVEECKTHLGQCLRISDDEKESSLAYDFAGQALDKMKVHLSRPDYIVRAIDEVKDWKMLLLPVDSKVVGYIPVGDTKIPVTNSLLDALKQDNLTKSFMLEPV